MKYLSVCIPNYNRLEKLNKLLLTVADQILQFSFEDEVEICVSDDCSIENPTNLISKIRIQYPNIDIRYKRNSTNMGMDYNFLNSVLLSDSLYCWIIGNDDLPTKDGIKIAIENLKNEDNKIDLMVTPFDVLGVDEKIRKIVYPLFIDKEIKFNTKDKEDYNKLLNIVQHNSGLFGFLSNTIFKRKNWITYQNYFQNKMDTIFIQMYMNIKLLESGAQYMYLPQKIIKNYADDVLCASIKRSSDVLFGLNGVIDYFFDGEIKNKLKRLIVDEHIEGTLWDLPKNNEIKKKIEMISTAKNEIYRKFFVPTYKRKKFLENKKIILFGAGNYGMRAFRELHSYFADIVAVVDSDQKKCGENFEGYQIQNVINIKKIYELENAYIIIANHKNLEEMVQGLLNQDIDRLAVIT